MSARFAASLSAIALLLLGAACATVPPEAVSRDGFPLDPREGLAGPFPPEVERGWRALTANDPSLAAAEFERAASAGGGPAARVGLIEAEVAGGKLEESLTRCREAIEQGEATLPLLVACGEARARSGDLAGGYELYRQAEARAKGLPALAGRAAELRRGATDELLAAARGRAGEKDWSGAREILGRAIELSPESAPTRCEAGDVELAAGEKEEALARFQQALNLDPGDTATRARVGELAFELKDYVLAVSVFERLVREDRKFQRRAEEARLAFRVTNWPSAERDAARSSRLTRSAAAQLVWWMFPEIREMTVTSGVIASDVLGRRDSRALARALALGLLDAEKGTHRARPDAALGPGAAARLLLRLVDLLNSRGLLPCLPEGSGGIRTAAEAIRAAKACELWDEEPGPVTGAAFTRSLDRARSLASERPLTDEPGSEPVRSRPTIRLERAPGEASKTDAPEPP